MLARQRGWRRKGQTRCLVIEKVNSYNYPNIISFHNESVNHQIVNISILLISYVFQNIMISVRKIWFLKLKFMVCLILKSNGSKTAMTSHTTINACLIASQTESISYAYTSRNRRIVVCMNAELKIMTVMQWSNTKLNLIRISNLCTPIV